MYIWVIISHMALLFEFYKMIVALLFLVVIAYRIFIFALNLLKEEFLCDTGGTTLFKMDVEGIVGKLTTLVDSGCNRCVIRRDVLPDEIASKIITVKAKGKAVDGTEIQIIGSVKLSIGCLGNSVVMDFFVAKELVVPVILGINWIRESGANLQSDGLSLQVDFSRKKKKNGCSKDCLYCDAYVLVNVNGIGMVKALVDTGSATSSIRRDLLKDYQMSRVIQIPDKILLKPNGKKLDRIGNVSLNVTYQETETLIENVNVVSNMDIPLVLGMDWIHKTRVLLPVH